MEGQRHEIRNNLKIRRFKMSLFINIEKNLKNNNTIGIDIKWNALAVVAIFLLRRK